MQQLKNLSEEIFWKARRCFDEVIVLACMHDIWQLRCFYCEKMYSQSFYLHLGLPFMHILVYFETVCKPICQSLEFTSVHRHTVYKANFIKKQSLLVYFHISYRLYAHFKLLFNKWFLICSEAVYKSTF